MKASTLFALAVAGVLAIGTAIVAKQLGFFSTQPRVQTNNEPIKVLVASSNLFEGNVLNTKMVKVRNLRPDELAHYQSNKEKYLPAIVEAASLRVPNRNIAADSPILVTDLQDLAFAEGLTSRLGKDMRAVNVDVPRLRAAGGMIKTGDRVDILLTTSICADDSCKKPITQTAYIAHGLRIIAKRNIVWNVLAPIPDDKLLSFTLEANPYRAALIELAMTKGALTLMPTPSSASTGSGKIAFAVLDSTEYRDEDQRVSGMMKGEYVVGDADLERIFKLRPIVRAEATAPPPPIKIQHISGTRAVGESLFDRSNGALVGQTNYGDSRTKSSTAVVTVASEPTVETGRPSLGYRFMPPPGCDTAMTAGGVSGGKKT